jgi:DHA2 family multidrug resistance protein
MAKLEDGWDTSRSAAGDHNPWLIAGILSIATFMEVLDTSIANVALRHIAGSLAVSTDESTWVITSYLVANAGVLPTSGWLSGVVGRKRFYLFSVALFTLSSLACGLAPSLPLLIVARVLQGVGGGGLAPSEQSMLADSFPPSERAKAFAIYGVSIIVAPALGPTIGGWLTDNNSWHWIFFLNVPIGMASLSLVYLFVESPRRSSRSGPRCRAQKILCDATEVNYGTPQSPARNGRNRANGRHS